MKILKFELTGLMAHYQIPTITTDITTEKYLTYSNLTPVALKGLIGAIMGYNGLSKSLATKTYPENLEKLSELEFGILPNTEEFVFEKETHTLTNTTGFANQGENNVTQYEVLSHPSWTIYVKDSFEDFDLLCYRVLNDRTAFPTLLGKNWLQGTILNGEIIEVEEENEVCTVDNYIPKEMISYTEDEINLFETSFIEKKDYSEVLPIDYSEEMSYIYTEFIYSNRTVTEVKVPVIKDKDKFIAICKMK